MSDNRTIGWSFIDISGRHYLWLLVASFLLILLSSSSATDIYTGFRLSITSVIIWSLGFTIVYLPLASLRDNDETLNRPARQAVNLLLTIAINAIIIGSLLPVAKEGVAISSLWPLLIIPLFATVEKSSLWTYRIIILFVLFSNLALFSIDTLYNIQPANSTLVASFFLLSASGLLFRNLAENFQISDYDVQSQLIALISEVQEAWRSNATERLFSAITNLVYDLFSAEKVEMILINNSMGVGHSPITMDSPNGPKQNKGPREFFEISGQLKHAVESGNIKLEHLNTTQTKNWFLRFLGDLLAVFPTKDKTILYIPIKDYNAHDQTIAVLKVHLKLRVITASVTWTKWKNTVDLLTFGLSSILNDRDVIKTYKTLENMTESIINTDGRGLIKIATLDFASIFGSPAVFWERESGDILTATFHSKWFSRTDAHRQYVSSQEIKLGRGYLGELINDTDSYDIHPQIIKANSTEHSGDLEKLGINYLLVIPINSGIGNLGALVLYMPFEPELNFAKLYAIKNLGNQLLMGLERRKIVSFNKKFPSKMQRMLSEAEIDVDSIISQIAIDGYAELKADIIDFFEVDEPSSRIVSARRSVRGIPDPNDRLNDITQEEYDHVINMASHGYPVFVDDLQTSDKPEFPHGTMAFCALPLSLFENKIGVLLFHYLKPHLFTSERRLQHTIYALLIEHMILLSYHYSKNSENISLQERNKIAEIIHGSISDRLLALSNWIEGLGSEISKVPSNDKLSAIVETISMIAKYCYQSVQDLQSGLWAPDIQQVTTFGLEDAIQNYFRILGAEIKLSVEVKGKEAAISDLNTKADIFRFCCLALTNIVKHSRARNAIVRVWAEKGNILVSVEDDGVGFDPAKVRKNNTIGLRSMEAVINGVGGNFSVTTKADQGTKVTATIPQR